MNEFEVEEYVLEAGLEKYRNDRMSKRQTRPTSINSRNNKVGVVIL